MKGSKNLKHIQKKMTFKKTDNTDVKKKTAVKKKKKPKSKYDIDVEFDKFL